MKGALVGAIASSIVMISASALAGTGIGGVFNLGKTNNVNAQTILTGKVKGRSLQGITGNDGGGNNFRYDCVLAGPAATIDDPIYRVGETNDQENYLTYQGAYSGAGPITLTCRSANVHTLTALSGSIVAIKVGT